MVTVAVIEGDGIGPEVVGATLKVLEKIRETFKLPLEFVFVEAGDRAKEKYGEALPKESYERLLRADAILKGPVGETAADVIVRLRRELDLFANIRPAKVLPGVPALKENVDLIIVRENIEDLYVGAENLLPQTSLGHKVAVGLRLASERETRRVAKVAAEYAKARRNKVTIVHKANVMRVTCGLFRDVAKEVLEAEGVEVDEMYVDAAAMELVRRPERFDVMLTPNVFGDILSDLAAQVVGSLGLAPSGNIGEERALFEPVHGAAFDIAGKGIANPTATMLAASMMLEWLERKKGLPKGAEAAAALQRAIEKALSEGVKTPDLGGNYGTFEFAEEVVKRLQLP
ncbi:isocitrate/isopropylmalate dehydrogenase family protein [Ignicoccus hospitalis]|uniref:3-isopropylmalate dehydrogenase n=1 Tax=Ignicoccus hospitalis (strain KIN4/I / DSM 18386 / JCM 14125) TaxID=453591 RepID=A8AB60_IGNH4|nr:isocitrate/isopropylmalate dehydrogenase family protein [Ignicoccus hospitalis]ABU82162.1 3-isopropylmalate dehydrogenase [Ignicoccus hospitalis KIN4/I]HIH91120.1 isocitrate/isopropylmalate dehydrogenase family protein [Desulfurococcaceae archaeon]